MSIYEHNNSILHCIVHRGWIEQKQCEWGVCPTTKKFIIWPFLRFQSQDGEDNLMG
jgi:hypothetical protein